MKKIFLCPFALLLMVILLCGCDFWMNGSRYSVNKHQQNGFSGDQIVEISDYSRLLSQMISMVQAGGENSAFQLTDGTSETLQTYMSEACEYIKNDYVLGAYAVDEITYEITQSRGEPVAAVKIKYLRTQAELLRMKLVLTVTDAERLIRTALENVDDILVLRVLDYQQTDFSQIVEDYFHANPAVCMELPQVKTAVYPDSGQERIVELRFIYQTNRNTLRSMQEMVAQIFDSASLYISASDTPHEKYAQLFRFLMQRYDYTIETSITPSYSLLRYGVGDNRAFADVYAAMCRQSGLPCQVVSGTRDGQAWFWNVVKINGVYYHIDLLRCDEQGMLMMKTKDQMSGYVWDYSEYELLSVS